MRYGGICAKELKVHEQVLTTDVTCVIIEEIQVEQLSEPETTYNFEVEDFHTYYVWLYVKCCGMEKIKKLNKFLPNSSYQVAT